MNKLQWWEWMQGLWKSEGTLGAAGGGAWWGRGAVEDAGGMPNWPETVKGRMLPLPLFKGIAGSSLKMPLYSLPQYY